MEDRQRILSFYFENAVYQNGSIDITEKLYEVFPKDKIEVIKYMMPSVTEAGIYFTVVFLEKEENAKSGMGFQTD
ncbi:MAG: hypothetical protein AAFP02_11185 [Bacteroidota bacterium]